MKQNRSMPRAAVTPVLIYVDMEKAIEWLTHAFGFHEVWRIEDHGALLALGEGEVYVRPPRDDKPLQVPTAAGAGCSSSIMWRLDEVERVYERVKRADARIIMETREEVYGERQFAVEDIEGHHWTFSETIADRAPEEWGAKVARRR